MKIGIITLPLHINFGGFLQNYALQEVLRRMGHDPITLNQRVIPRPVIPQVKEIVFANLHTLFLRLLGKRGERRFLHYHSTSLRPLLWRNSLYFFDKYIKHTDALNPNKDYYGICEKMSLNALVVGSDQVWRPKYVENISTMYLGFEASKNIKKIAYAASFGTSEWEYTPEQTSMCSNFAKQFNLITVRESSAIDMTKEHFTRNAEMVLDPTLLLNKEDYIKLIEKEQEPKSEGNLFCYILDMTDSKRELITYVEEELGLKSFYVNIGENTRPYSKKFIKRHLERFQNPTITKWLRGFMDAEMIIADSFHAVAFSIIFNKPFWVVGNPGRGMARFESILSLFNLQSRLVSVDSFQEKNLAEPIDWDGVNQIRKKRTEKSLGLLQNALSKGYENINNNSGL